MESILVGRYAVRRSLAEPACLEGGSSRRIHFVPLRCREALTGVYQQDHRRSRLGPRPHLHCNHSRDQESIMTD